MRGSVQIADCHTLHTKKTVCQQRRTTLVGVEFERLSKFEKFQVFGGAIRVAIGLEIGLEFGQNRDRTRARVGPESG
jgi:hypothetical protein